jgi:hypothetical protein
VGATFSKPHAWLHQKSTAIMPIENETGIGNGV